MTHAPRNDRYVYVLAGEQVLRLFEATSYLGTQHLPSFDFKPGVGVRTVGCPQNRIGEAGILPVPAVPRDARLIEQFNDALLHEVAYHRTQFAHDLG